MSDISTLIGIILDVSGSMERNVDGGVLKQVDGGDHEKVRAWAWSILDVINNLIKYDVSSSNYVFAVGVGASCGNGIFDLIGTLEQIQIISNDGIKEGLQNILDNSGAGEVINVLQKRVSNAALHDIAASLKPRLLESDPTFASSIANNCLPPAYTDLGDTDKSTLGIESLNLGNAMEEDVKRSLLKDVNVMSSIFSVQKAYAIVHGCVTEEDLTEVRIQKLMERVVPFIYGNTPLLTSLKKAAQLFSVDEYRKHRKLLFVLSDGEPSDHGTTDQLLAKFRNANVTVVGCFITQSTHVEPHRLYSIADREWGDGAKFLFELSSSITTQLLPRTIFIKRGWKIDIENNETKLFLQVNHPDNIKDACDLARNVVCCQDALSDILASVSLDIYINQSTTGFGAPNQVGGTCYANASAAVVHLSTKRILGREGGYPDFKQLRQQLIDHYGDEGANTLNVLQEVCPQYRLRCQEVNIVGAMKAITAKRLVVATFYLTDAEWGVFKRFYGSTPTAILTQKEIDIPKRPSKVETSGHAVVLTSYNSECLRLMNSWGHEWGDMGFFRVKTADVIGLKFVDVFWESEDLTENEKACYDRHGAEVAKWLMDNLTGLQLAEYKCPVCIEKSLVTEFKGQLLRAICPKCSCKFRSDEAGNILALNMYLTSLSR